MASIKNQFQIDATREKVYQAITSIEGLSNWWTTETSGDTNLGGVIQFRFGDFAMEMKVAEMTPSESLTWECISGADDWIGTLLTFKLDTNEGKTRVRFEHAGWKEANDFFGMCSFSWGRYMESLRQYCQTGTGAAFGSGTYNQ